LGLNLIALSKEAYARKIILVDVNAQRLELARKFGADAALNTEHKSDQEIASLIRGQAPAPGVDAAFEVCGSSQAVLPAIQSLRIGGRYLIAGLVSPGSHFQLDGDQITRKCLTIKGIHNYKPRHLAQALQFLAKYACKYPYAAIVGETFPLNRINQALEAAASARYIRVAVTPS